MKAQIYHSQGLNYVTVEEDNPQAEYADDAPARISTTYFCPINGGYVRIADEAGHNPQVCEGLANRGNTLRCEDPANLIDLIRRERARAAAWNRRNGV
jgi:hypothetical protein